MFKAHLGSLSQPKACLCVPTLLSPFKHRPQLVQGQGLPLSRTAAGRVEQRRGPVLPRLKLSGALVLEARAGGRRGEGRGFFWAFIFSSDNYT